MTNFVIPLMLDVSTNAIIYGESDPSLVYDYAFDTVTGEISVTQMKTTFKYKDDDVSGGPYLKYDVNAAGSISNVDWHNLMTTPTLKCTNIYRNATVAPTDAVLGEHVVQWIASTLFGHPQAQAPITNDTDIINDISDSNLGLDLYNQLSGNDAGTEAGTKTNEVLQSMWEQLVHAGRFNDGSGADASGNSLGDTDAHGFQSFPYNSGDTLSFLIKIGSAINNDGNDYFSTEVNGVAAGVSSSNMNTLFGGITGYDNVNGNALEEQVWKFTFELSA